MTGTKHARLIARNELRRRWRSVRDNTSQLLAFGFLGLIAIPMSLGGLFGAYILGGAVGSGDIQAVLEWSRMAFVYGWLYVSGFGGYRAYALVLRPDNVDGLLSTVSHRELLGGLVLAELALWMVLVLTAGGGLAIAFGIGAGSVVSIPLAVLAISLTVLSGLVAGFAVALAVRNTGVRSVLLTRLRTLLLALLAVSYFGVILSNSFTSVLEPLYHLLAPTPIAWFGDLAVVGLDVGASSVRAAGAVGFAGLVAIVSGPLLFRLAEWLWYADGVAVDHTVDRSSGRLSWLSGRLPEPTVGVIAADWKRARRSPLSLSFALYPLIAFTAPAIRTFETGTVSSSVPIWVLLCGTWITGSLFALNVLGHEGAALPVTLLSDHAARSLVVGHILSGILLTTPITVVGIIATGLLSPHSLPVVASLAVAGLILSAAAGAIATGIGVAFPRFEAVSVSRSTKAIVPSTIAFGIYSVIILAVSLPAAVGHVPIVSQQLISLLGVDRLTVGAVGGGISGILAIAAGVMSAIVAFARVDGYRIE